MMKILERPFAQDFAYPRIFIFLLGVIFFIPFLGNVHLFDWDEINFAESAREMLVTGNYFQVTIDFVPFWEKPPLFFWFQAISMHVFGINEFAARFPNVLCGIITLLILYSFGKNLYGHRFGMLWAILYMGALLPHLYFKSGIIDPVFNLFIFLSIWNLLKTIGSEEGKDRSALLSGAFAGLAILTKGPVGLLIVLLTFLVYWGSMRFKKITKWKHVLFFAMTAFLISCFWFLPETIKNGPWFIVKFVEYQIRLLSTPDAGHQQPFYYHFVVVLIGCFPFSVFAIKKILPSKIDGSTPMDMKRWMVVLFWVVMILFTIVKTKIVHYSSMAYLPLSFLAVLYIHECIENNKRPANWLMIINLIVGLILSFLITTLSVLLIRKDWLSRLIHHPSLNVEVPMNGMEYLIGIFFLTMTVIVFVLIRKGRVFQGLMLNALALGSTLFLTSYLIVPKVEAYSQRPAIDFYQSIQREDAYVYPMFKTYAHYFYARISPEQSTKDQPREWYLKGAVDKPVYIIEFSGRVGPLMQNNQLTHLYTEGDFAFFKRK